MGMDVGHDTGGKKGKSRPEMNVTPLVDVVLVLLIIFMVMTPMMNKQFWLDIPNEPDEDAEPAEPQSDGPIVVTVDAEGRIHVNRDVFTDDELRRRLPRMLAAKGDRKIFFDADNQADFGRVVQVLDLARGGGAARIAVMTKAISR